MSFLVLSSRLRRVLVALVLLGGLSALGARDLELTGAYADEGTVAVAPPERADGVVSLHALLSLEFVPGLAKILHDRTGQVRLQHAAGVFSVQVLDREDQVIWKQSWKEGEGYRRDGETLVLHLRPGRKDREEFLLIFATINPHRLLQVEVQRLTPTILGPLSHPLGTYLFPRSE